MSDNKVTDLPVRRKDTSSVLTVAYAFSGCQHKRAVVDEKLAELTCADCGAKLNPIKFLVELTHMTEMWKRDLNAIAAARKELDERKRCRCTKCGEWTEIRRVHNREVRRLQSGKDGGR